MHKTQIFRCENAIEPRFYPSPRDATTPVGRREQASR
jgi:hypothetical protein